MNYTPLILDLFRRKGGSTEILFVPSAPPLERLRDRLVPLTDTTLSPSDIRETLNALREKSRAFKGPLEREGFFSFGIEGVGRIRVGYITQRGSYMFSVVNVPFEIPDISKVSKNGREEIRELISLVESSRGRVIYVIGDSFMVHNTFTFSLLKEISAFRQDFIYILERPITYLLPHDRSVVVQRELSVDVDTLQQGIEEALLLDPDIVYISDIALMDREALSSIARWMPFPFTLLISQTIPDATSLRTSIDILLGEMSDTYKAFVSKVVELKQSEDKIGFALTDIRPQVEGSR